MHTQDRVAADIAAGGQGIGDTGDNAMMLMCGWLPGLLYGIPLLLIDWMLFPRPPEMLRDPEEVLCASCGYDLRASPERCPECRAV